MIGQMAIASRALPGFNGLGRLLTHIFLLMDHFVYRFFHSLRKNEENLSIKSLNLMQNATSNSVLFSSLFICVAVSNASRRLKFCEALIA